MQHSKHGIPHTFLPLFASIICESTVVASKFRKKMTKINLQVTGKALFGVERAAICDILYSSCFFRWSHIDEILNTVCV